MIINCGGDVNARNKHNETALELGHKRGNEDAMIVLKSPKGTSCP